MSLSTLFIVTVIPLQQTLLGMVTWITWMLLTSDLVTVIPLKYNQVLQYCL